MTSEIKVEFDVTATMRDGTELKANIFRPADEGTYPVALSRTPYGKDYGAISPILDAVRLAQAGYIVVLQDCRGRFKSGGEWEPFRYEGPDGYDTVEWAAGLPGSNGNVGMYGASYVGFTQWIAAVEQPPHLKAIMPVVTWADQRDGPTWRGGALELGLVAYWQLNAIGLDLMLKRTADAPLPQKFAAISTLVTEINRLREEGYYSLPLKDFAPLHKVGLDDAMQVYRENPYSREVAAPYSVYEHYRKIKVPAFNVGGWYDILCQGTLQNFAALREGAGGAPEAAQNRLLIGPWSHVGYQNVVGEVDFGFGAAAALVNLQTDLTGLTQRWFDYWLKGIENGVTTEPPVKLFVMGDNTWRDEAEWPLARTQYIPYYIHSGGAANTLHGNGTLTIHHPGDEKSDSFIYDPAQPVPTRGGNILMNALFTPGPKDQRPTEEREDVLVYTSAPLTDDLEVTGPVEVKLWASSEGHDTDFVARLSDVYPDGFVQNLCDGIIRASYRNGDRPELLEPGEVYQFTIKLWATSNVFKTGHRLRVDLTSSNFPRWNRNPNTGASFGDDAEFVSVRQTILHDVEHPSHILLPIIPR